MISRRTPDAPRTRRTTWQPVTDPEVLLERARRVDRARAEGRRGRRRGESRRIRERLRRLLRPSVPRTSPGTRIAAAAAIAVVGASIVSTSVPANAYYVDTPAGAAAKFASAALVTDAQPRSNAVIAAEQAQSFVAEGATAPDASRDGYRVTVPAPKPVSSTGAGSPIGGAASRAVQWPFPGGAPISSGFGARQVARCSFCSTNHLGLDFTPGAGTPIHSVAAGVVSRVDRGSGALGVNVWVDHVIAGRAVTTVYAHMLAGSPAVAPGQRVAVGQVLGRVGSTGNSTGAHLHFEVHVAGRAVDPLPWLRAHAG
ncbi:M23 family metallopeptidase [Frondihabitans australicus]|uniref:Murein DD-endopeptidase MepM/ murein hydrolase activator NlpD n=1 Tax=Frondihabitans australicus TaxID=386892 RepID=A0A495ID94_9MICO|nr:M23 family metallopeptidase [Frondihabitans australicus]RKR73075.1 murein DD-endopeptidase MepM/ murein hydrolase activator NlpD [Frondihabitans australicus]